jgi:hypothetical protein
MFVILLFNQAGPDRMLSVRIIKEAMKIDDEACIKNIRSLMIKNFKLLEIRGMDALSGKLTPG